MLKVGAFMFNVFLEQFLSGSIDNDRSGLSSSIAFYREQIFTFNLLLPLVCFGPTFLWTVHCSTWRCEVGLGICSFII